MIYPYIFASKYNNIQCDSGWRRVYDKLLASKAPTVQESLDCWLPPGSGLREEISRISNCHPDGFPADNVVQKLNSPMYLPPRRQ